MKNIDSHSHVRGESVYLDDIPVIRGTLYACVFDSPIAHGRLKSVDTRDAEKCEGVIRVILAKDLIGENQIGGIVPAEPLLADGEVHFVGQPIGIVLAGFLMALSSVGGEMAATSMGLPSAAIQVFQGMLLFFLLGVDVLTNYRIRLGLLGAR